MSYESVARVSTHHERERLLRRLALATFFIFFQAYMVAPIIPALANAFATSAHTAGFVVPAYLIPYGVATLVFGLLADRIGVQRVMFASRSSQRSRPPPHPLSRWCCGAY